MKRVIFGTDEKADYQFQINENDAGNCPEVRYKGTSFQSKLIGNYNVHNVAAAIAIGLQFDIPLKEIKKGIESYEADNNRSQVIRHKNKKIVLDAYNANPSSMEAALLNFSKLKGDKAVVLGDMFELGEASLTEHQRIATLTGSLGFQKVFLVGNYFSQVNLNGNQNFNKFENRESAEKYFEDHPIEEEILLIKGSRGMALEKILDFL